jgi:peptide methionine sulfoxide reductase MsrA
MCPRPTKTQALRQIWEGLRARSPDRDAAKLSSRPIVTRGDPWHAFCPAESYHQDFVARHPRHSYVVVNDLTKVRNLKQRFPELYRETPRAQD